MPADKVDAATPRDPQAERREHYRYLKQRTFCEMCGAEAVAEHCKIVCPRCGYRVTCSDPI